MGNKLNKRRCDKEIISKKSLMGVLQLLNFLKQNVRSRELFHGVAHDGRVQQIVDDLQKGSARLQKVVEQNWVAEALAAVEYFLVMRLKEPLIPHYVQVLALDENTGVSAEIIAQDILGLLRQDLSGRHEILLCCLLDFLNAIIQYTPIDELRGYCVPGGIFPIFFNKPTMHSNQWRKARIVFLELIRLAPLYFEIPADYTCT